jgi:hypothetical protein
MDVPAARAALFISHANPEDNAFVRWLGAKLTALGYEVWADLLEFRGGMDWERRLEDALRHRAIKMLLVCTPASLAKQGVRNEITIASQVGRSLSDPEFIIPLRLQPYETSFQIAQAQWISFSPAWASGFAELSELLAANTVIPREPNRNMDQWLSDQTNGAARLVSRKELLVSNWLHIRSKPSTIYYCEPPAGFPLEQFQARIAWGWPIVPFRGGVLTFTRPDLAGRLSDSISARIVAQLDLENFLHDGWEQLGIQWFEANRLFADLGNQAFDLFMQKRDLIFYEDAKGRRSWWADIKTSPKTQVAFAWKTLRGSRQIMGQSEKRGVFWHYALSGQVRDTPKHHFRISARLIFSTNGLDAVNDAKKMHRLRRSFAKGWRNARWRDMLLAYLWWISDGKDEMSFPVSPDFDLVVSLPPRCFTSAVGVSNAEQTEPDEDDPDVEFEYWDEVSDEDE